MTRIVRTAYRYKRPPRRKKPVALEVPAVINAASKRKRASAEAKAALAASLKQAPGEAERKPAGAPQRAAKAAIVTIRRQAARIIPPDLLAETRRSTGGAATPPTRCGANWCSGSPRSLDAAATQAASVRALPCLRHGILEPCRAAVVFAGLRAGGKTPC